MHDTIETEQREDALAPLAISNDTEDTAKITDEVTNAEKSDDIGVSFHGNFDTERNDNPLAPLAISNAAKIRASQRQISESSPKVDASSPLTPSEPDQPLLKEYPLRTFGKEKYKRKFQPEWYKKYPWISYDINNDQRVCFLC